VYCLGIVTSTFANLLTYFSTRKLSSIKDRGQTNRVAVWPWPSIPGQLRSWHIYMQNVRVKGQLVWKSGNGGDCITSHANTGGNHLLAVWFTMARIFHS